MEDKRAILSSTAAASTPLTCPKVKIEMVLPDHIVDRAIQAITHAARTGKIGDGKIFLARVDEAIRIRNDDRGENAL